jgi:hypothetical protein
MALSVIGWFGYLLPAHKVEGHSEWHSNFADGGVFPLIAFGVVLATAILLRRGRLGAGMVTGVVAIAGAIGAVMPVFLVHLFSHVDYSIGEDMLELGCLGLFFGGLTMLLAEPLLYWSQRRSLERTDPQPPQLPLARVV